MGDNIMKSFQITTNLTKVVHSLGLDINEGVVKENPFQPELTTLEFDSVYTDSRFRENEDGTVTRMQAHFAEDGNKVVTNTTFRIVEDDDISYITSSTDDIKDIAKRYNHYVGALEFGYFEGLVSNKRVLEDLKEQGVISITYKNITPMFTNVTRDFTFNLYE